MQFKLLKHTNFLVISESILVKQADIYKPYNLYNILRKTSLDNVLRVFRNTEITTYACFNS